MKNIFKYILAFAAVSAAAVSCVKEQPFQAGDPEEDGCYGVYFPAQEETDLVLDPAESRTATISVMRTNTEGAITVPIEVTDTAGIFTVSTLSFEDGQSESSIRLDFPDAQVGVSYGLSLQITDWQYASKYSTNPTALGFSVLIEKWNDLGEGTFIDAVANQVLTAFEVIEAPVHIYQNDADETQYRIPMEGLYSDAVDDYLYFTLMKPGNAIGSIPVTQTGLVWFDPFDTGISVQVDDGVVGSMIYYHRGALSGSTEALWAYSHVAQYADDGTSPAVVRLAPYVLIGDTGYGADMSQTADAITIIFPGEELVDYSLSVKTGESVDGQLPVQFITGADVAQVRYAVYEGTLSAGAVANYASLIGTGEEKSEVAPSGAFNISCPATGVYTLVAVSFDESGAAHENTSAEIHYVAAGDEMPVMVTVGIEATNKYGATGNTSDNTLEYYIYGSDLTSVKTLLVTADDWTSDPDAVLAGLERQPDVDAATLADINGAGTSGVYKGQTPGTEYMFFVYASNGYESTVVYATARTTGVLDVNLEDIFGVYDVTYESYFEGPGLKDAWTIEASDDPAQGNIMLTSLYGLSGGNPVYGTFDKESATLAFGDGQYISTVNGTDVYFMNASSYDPVVFDIVGDIRFTGPSEMFGLSAGAAGTSWYEVYVSVDAVRTGDAAGASASGAFASEKAATVHETGTKLTGSPVAYPQPTAVLCGPREIRQAEFTVTPVSGTPSFKNTVDFERIGVTLIQR